MKKKTLLSCGATVAAFAIILAPVSTALAADETTGPTAALSVSEEAMAPADVPASDEAKTADPDPALVVEEPEALEAPVEATAPVKIKQDI